MRSSKSMFLTRLQTKYKVQALALLFTWQVGMTFSMEFLLSVSMIGLLLLALFQQRSSSVFSIGWRKGIGNTIRRFFSNRGYLVISIPFLLVFFSAVYSSDLSYTLERLRIKLPFLVLPFAFFSIPDLSKRDFYTLLLAQLMLSSLASMGVLGNYLLDFSEINQRISRGQVMYTPGNHIRFSLILAFSILLGGVLFFKKFYLKYEWEPKLIASLTLFLFIFLHVLSVRSGLLVMYSCLLLLALRYIWISRNLFIGGLALLAVVLVPVLAVQFVPSLHSKINYMKYDWQMYQEGTGANYSDSERLISLQSGWAIFQENKYLGVGAGDLKEEVKTRYEEHYKNVNLRMPHNQLLTILAGTGIVGLLFFLYGFFYPLFYNEGYRDALFLSFHALVFLSFMMENTLETAVGVSIFLFYLLLMLRVRK